MASLTEANRSSLSDGAKNNRGAGASKTAAIQQEPLVYNHRVKWNTLCK